jgi:hypothetical protein
MSSQVTYGVVVDISRFADAAFPGFVECQLVDISGHIWRFLEKAPVVSTEHLTAESAYPRRGVVACEVLSQQDGKVPIVVIDTSIPWGVETVDGNSRFTVAAKQLVRLDCAA